MSDEEMYLLYESLPCYSLIFLPVLLFFGIIKLFVGLFKRSI